MTRCATPSYDSPRLYVRTQFTSFRLRVVASRDKAPLFRSA